MGSVDTGSRGSELSYLSEPVARHASDFSGLWIYLVAPVIGGVIAALIYSFLRDEKA